MKQIKAFCTVCVAAWCLGSPPSACAQERVEHVVLVERGPDVAIKGGTVQGFSLDYWRVGSNFDPVARAGETSRGTIPGFGLWYGQGPWVGNFQYRGGKTSTADASGAWQSDRLSELEFTARYQYAEGLGLLLGVIHKSNRYDLRAPDGQLFAANDLNTLRYTRSYTAPLVGYVVSLGLGERTALRVDLKLGYGKLSYQGIAPIEDTGRHWLYYGGSAALGYRISETGWLRGGLKLSALSRTLGGSDLIDKTPGLFLNYAVTFR